MNATIYATAGDVFLPFLECKSESALDSSGFCQKNMEGWKLEKH